MARAPAKRLSKAAIARAQWLQTFLKTGSESAARQASGLGPRAKQQIIRHLENNQSLDNHKPPGRPEKYTTEVMQRAVQVLIEHEDELPNLTNLLQILVDEKTVAAPADVKNFGQHLRQYVREQGHYLNASSTETTFFLQKSDRPKRVDFCKKVIKLVRGDVGFIDEATFEEAPHPKGAVGFNRKGWGLGFSSM